MRGEQGRKRGIRGERGGGGIKEEGERDSDNHSTLSILMKFKNTYCT